MFAGGNRQRELSPAAHGDSFAMTNAFGGRTLCWVVGSMLPLCDLLPTTILDLSVHSPAGGEVTHFFLGPAADGNGVQTSLRPQTRTETE